MKIITYKRYFILSLLSFVLLIFCIIYKNSYNLITSSSSILRDYLSTSQGNDLLGSLEKVAESIQVQFIFRMMSIVLSLYFSSLFCYMFLKIYNKIRKNSPQLDFATIVSAHYFSLYSVIGKYIIMTIYMLFVKKSLDSDANLFYGLYNLLFAGLSYVLIVYFIQKSYPKIKPVSFYFVSIFLIYSIITCLGGYN